ncbi:heavy metal translocatin [Clathrospora elynae]|uniref:Heavy metal translocatin n=1 Tax=Clathrospora elynae TaxID=706981 RepID=A0A6A5T2Y1_9PLEO|nr:heavy metal translocatin [Clathrospora elynae]
MEMRMLPTKTGVSRAELLGISQSASPDKPTASSVPEPNLHAAAYRERASYSGPPEPNPQQERDCRSFSRVFPTNGVQYLAPESETVPTIPTHRSPIDGLAAVSAPQLTETEAMPPPLQESASTPPESTMRHPPPNAPDLPMSPPVTPPSPAYGHDHGHAHSHHHTSSTAVPSHKAQPDDGSGSGTAHTHSHSSGICCSKSSHSSGDILLKDSGDAPNESEYSDVEKGPAKFERIILRIDGLKCGCCDAGLSRAISRIPAIQNHQVNTVLARVELDLDTNRLPVKDVIKRLNTKTGYTFEEHVAPVGQVLDFIITDPRRIQYADKPFGILRIEAPEREPWRPLQLLSGRNSAAPIKTTDSAKSTHLADDYNDTSSVQRTEPGAEGSIAPQIRIPPTRIHYNAHVIGARDIFDHYKRFDPDLRLAPPIAQPGLALGAKLTKRALLWFLPSLVFTIPVAVLAWAPIDHDKNVYAHISLAFATAVQLIALREFVPSALQSLYHSQVFEMDFLVAFSTTAAYIFSVVSYVFQIRGRPLETGSFFETSTLLVTLILLGRFINEFARFRAAQSVSFRSLQIDEALLVLDASTSGTNHKTKRIDARLLQYGDTFKIPPHTKVVTDGTVQHGGSEIDESMITGESIPVAKGVGSDVFAGTNNGDGELIVRLDKLPHENSVHNIAAMVEDAEMTKPKTQALADRIAGWFVPAIATIGCTVFLTWLFVERFHNNNAWNRAVITAITYAIATLVVSCPCAIGLAVPMVVLIAGGVAARFGIIFRDPQKLEIARSVTDIVFDKTGTLTCGDSKVVGVPKYHGTDRSYTRGLTMTLLKDIKHPVSAGVWRFLNEDKETNNDFEPLDVINITSIPGCGVQGTCAETGVVIRAGNHDWLDVQGPEGASNTFCYVSIGGVLSATFELTDRQRPTAEIVLKRLFDRGIQVHMISGDTEGAVHDIAGALNIQRSHTKSRCNPEGKMNYIQDLQQAGRVVMFVGDGTNDSVALKQADVGVHINQGSDIAKSAADVVLMTARLHDILILLDISHAAYQRIILNFSWSALYNVFAILLAAGAFVEAREQMRITPQWAGLGELVSVLPVVLIAFQMRWRNYGKKYRVIESDYVRSKPQKRERKDRTRGSSSTESAGCCEVPAPTLAKLDAVTRFS